MATACDSTTEAVVLESDKYSSSSESTESCDSSSGSDVEDEVDISFEELATAIAIQLHISYEEAEQLLAAVLEYVEVLAELDMGINALLPNYERWLKMRDSSIAKLEELASNLDTHHENVNIANLTASSVGAAGGALAITGAVLSFFTFGLAAPLAVAGTAMAVSGGVTSLGASLAEYGITKDRCSDAQKVHDDDMKETEQIVESLNKVGELTDKLEAILAVLEEFELDPSDGSDVECQNEHQAMLVAEGESLVPPADVECLAKDQATQIGSQGAGNNVSSIASGHAEMLGGTIDGRERQKLMALKSSSAMAGMVYQTKCKTLVGRGESSGSTTLGGAMVGGAVIGVGAVVMGTFKSQRKLMTGVGKAGKVAKLAGRMGKVVRVTKLAGNVGNAGKAAKFAGTMGKMGKIGSAGTSAAKIGRVGLKVGGAALSAVGLGFDIWTIVTTAKDISEGSKSPAGVQLRNRSGEMRKQRKKASKIMEQAKKAAVVVFPPAAVVVVSKVYDKLTRNRNKHGSDDHPKKGHHVINNDVRRVLPKIIDEFIFENRELFSGKKSKVSKYDDLKDKVSKSSRVNQAYEQPLSRDVEQAIKYELVVHTPPNQTHNEENAQKYGAAIKQLREDVVKCMNWLFKEMINHEGELPSGMPDKVKIKNEVDTMNAPGKEVFVDHQALVWWLVERGNSAKAKAKYERCRDHVAEMFKRLHSKEIPLWVSELYWVYKEMNS